MLNSTSALLSQTNSINKCEKSIVSWKNIFKLYTYIQYVTAGKFIYEYKNCEKVLLNYLLFNSH